MYITRYSNVHITYTLCTCHMHFVLSSAICAIYGPQIHTHISMHMGVIWVSHTGTYALAGSLMPENSKWASDFSTRGCDLHNARWRAIGPSLSLPGWSWPILRPWQDRSQRQFLQNQAPEKQLVWTCQAGPSTSRGLVNTWWSQTWHSLSRTRWASHGLHAPRGMQTRPFGLHKVLAVYTAYAFYVCT